MKRWLIALFMCFSSLLPASGANVQDEYHLEVKGYWSIDVLTAVKARAFHDVISLFALDDGRDWLVVRLRITNTSGREQKIHSDRVQLRSGGEMIKQTRQESEDAAARLGAMSIGGDRHTVPAGQVLDVVQVYKVAPEATEFTLAFDFTRGWEINIDGLVSASAGLPGALHAVATAVEATASQATQSPDHEPGLTIAISEANDSGVFGDATLTDNHDSTTTIDILLSGTTGDHSASLRRGTCADLGDEIALLTEVDAEGSSVTDVPFELSALQDPHLGPHAVAIYRSADENSSVMACSEIPLVPVEPIQLIAAEVVEIIDAQRLLVEIEGKEFTVVLIGVDAPTASECYGDLAEARVKRLARKGTVIRLEADEIGEDAEGNLLRYVWIDRNDERQLLNRELIEEGYAAFKPDKDNGRHDEELEEAERAAIEGNKRIWSKCGGPHLSISGAAPAAPSATFTAVPAKTRTPVAQAEPSGGLGLSRAAWEAEHGQGEDVGLVAYEDKRFLVMFWSNDRVYNFSMNLSVPVSPAEAQTIALTLIPWDSVHVESRFDEFGNPMDVYRSAWLAAQFPVTADSDPFLGSPPGTLFTLYTLDPDGSVSSLLIAASDKP